MLGPLSIGAVGRAAMMLWNPVYWGLYYSMSTPQQMPARRAATETALRVERAESGSGSTRHNAAVVGLAA